MPREFRRITFSYEELPEALNSCGAKVSKKLSKGSITSVISKMIDGSFFYSFQLFDAPSAKETHVDIPEHDVTEALISYCLERGIPLPRALNKTVRNVNQDLCLDFLVGEAETRDNLSSD